MAFVARHPAGRPASAPRAQKIRELLQTTPLAFERNEGQTAKQVQYFARGSGYTLFLTPGEAVLSVPAPAGNSPTKAGRNRPEEGRKPRAVRLKVVGANPDARVEAVGKLPTRTNYFLGNDPSQWKRDVPTFSRIRYHKVYDGIDLVYHGSQGALEYDFEVQPSSDPKAIRLSVDGADRLELEPDGDLLLHTGAGVVRQPRPTLYQEVGGKRREVDGGYVRLASGDIGFRVGAYDRDRTLVIDPVINYSTMIGGTGGEEAFTFCDTPRGMIVGGYTGSTDFPVTGLPGEDTARSGSTDAFLYQFDSGTNGPGALISATYLGGSGDDQIRSAVAANPTIYVTGETTSSNFPVTTGFGPAYAGNGDAFVAVLRLGGTYAQDLGPQGIQLQAARFLGGSGADRGKGIAYTSSGLVVVGSTGSTNFPTLGTGSAAWHGGATDGFVTSLPTTVNGLTVSTYLGGNGDDSANGVAADPDGRIYVTGGTSSSNFPIAGDPHFFQNQGGTDAFLTRFDPLLIGVSVPASTYIGGGSTDIGHAVAADAYGQIYVTGETHSSNFPASTLLGSAQTGPAGFGDAFVCRVNRQGRLEYSTYLGGGNFDAGYAIGLRDRPGQVAVGGVSAWGGLPYTYDGQGAGTSGNGFVSIVDTFYPGANSVSATGYLSGAAVYDVGAYGLHDSRVAAVGTTAWGIAHVDGPQGYAGGSDGFFANMNLFWGPSSWGLGVAAYETPYANPATVTLSLTRPDTNTSITVWRRAGTGSFQPLNVFPFADPMDPLQMSAVDASVAQGTTYTYVAHGNATGQVSYPFTMTTSLKAPTNLTATAVSENQIQLAWTNNAYNHTQFRIERRYGTVGSYSTVTFVPAGTHSYLDTVVNGSSATYYYRVYACNDVIESPASNVASATVQIVPAAPTGLSATAVSPTQVNLTWTDNATNDTGFMVERSLYSDFSGLSGHGENVPNVTSYSWTNLTQSTTYYFRVRSVRSGVNSAPSNVVMVTTPSGLPTAPSGLSASAISASQINLAWTDTSTNETGFKIERSTASSFNPVTLVTTTAVNATSYSDTGLAASTQYFYRVRATNTFGDSANSNAANATTLIAPPIAPSGLAATAVSGSEISLSWTDNSNNETSIVVQRARNSAFTTELVETTLNGSNITSHSTGTVLSPNTLYYFRVRAVNSAGTSGFSNVANATTPQVIPAVPGNLAVDSLTQTQINVTWTDNSSNESGFRLEYSLNSNFTSSTIKEYLYDNTYGTCSPLTANTTYYIRVRAYNSAGESANTPVLTVTTPPNPPASPLNFAATVVSQTQINLSWVDNSTNETGFRIERSMSTDYSGAVIINASANATSYANTGLTPNTQYVYRIRAYNTGGNSSYSQNVFATTPAFLPAAPSNLTATPISQSQINLSWADNSDNETGFELQRKQDAGAFLDLGPLPANTTSYSATSLSPYSTYTFRVQAVNSAGASSYATVGPVSPLPYPPVAPSSLQATGASGQISLSWTDNSWDEDSFEIQRSTDGTNFTSLHFTAEDVVSFVDTGLPTSVTRYYRVRAWNAGGASSFSNTASAITGTTPPSNLVATVFSNSRIDLVWDDNSSNESGFKIERSNDNFVNNIVQVATVGANVEAYSNTGLNNGVTFYYRVRAYVGSVDSDYSNVEITRTSQPAAPSNLVATAVSSSQIDLTWTDNSNNETEFKVLRSGNGTDYTVVGTVSRNATSYQATNLQSNKRYWFKVRAVNGAGDNVSNADSVWTLP